MIGAMLVALLAAAPDPVAWILQLRSADATCHGTPISPVVILTAAHCVGPTGIVRWEGQDRKGIAIAVWMERAPRDIALLVTGSANGWHFVPISKTPPNNMVELWWRLYLPEFRSVAGGGYALGIDETGDLDFFGPAEPGSSGSGLIDEHGELVGVITRTFNPFQVLQRRRKTRDRFNVLEEATAFLPLSSATPINAWPR